VRSLSVTALFVAFALALSGCVLVPGVREEHTAQRDVIGAMRVQTTLCPFVLADGPAATAPLPTRPASEPAGACARRFQDIQKGTLADLPGQVLLAFRVPAGVSAPDHLAATADVRLSELLNGSSANPVTSTRFELARSNSLEQALGTWYGAGQQQGTGAGALPAGLGAQLTRPGERLVGYVSDVLPGPLVGDVALTTDFGLPPGTAERPWAGPFNHLTLTGWRLALTQPLVGSTVQPATVDPARPVVCDATPAPQSVLDALLADQPAGDLTICPLPAGPVGTAAGLTPTQRLAGTSTPSHDLRVLGGAAAAEQGTVVGVPFLLRGSGPSVVDLVHLRASGGVPGSVPGSRYGEVPFPADRDDLRDVIVGVPPDTKPGIYDVGLTATIGGEERSGTAKLTVVPRTTSGVNVDPTAAGPGRQITVNVIQPKPPAPRERLPLSLDGHIRFGYVCPAPSAACASTTAILLVREDQLGRPASKGGLRMLRIGGGVRRTRSNTRVVNRLRVAPSAWLAAEESGELQALLVMRAGGSGPAQVRRVTIVAH
jgi:hypothetical protein